jgi:response regulator RpfG family c-di-GMP phosphodiesterase
MSPPRLLVADDDVSDLLVMRRLVRDTPYVVDTVRSASQALVALGKHEYAAVVADDERLPDMAGALLLAEVERSQRAALRILLSRPERAPALIDDAKQARYQLIARPFFARPLVASLVEHAARWLLPSSEREDTQRTVNPFIDDAESGEHRLGPMPAEEQKPPAPGRLAHRRVLVTLVELVEAKAGHCAGHGARVGALAAVLGRELGLGGETLEAVEDAALLHDVGELAVDPALWQEARPLTDDERREVRRHVESGSHIVRRAGLGDAVLEAVRYHHEPWERSGESIPVGARIIAVADVWDALATDRPYRAALPIDGCVRTFAGLGGALLDPHLVSVYLEKKLYDLIDWSDPPRPGVKLL